MTPPDPLKAKHEHKFTCERWNHNDESPDGRNSRHWLTCEVSGCSEWIWQFPSLDDPLKPKPETLGFEREVDTLCDYFGWDKGSEQAMEVQNALEAAFSKGIEEQEKRCGAHCVPVGEKAFSDGWNACREASAKVVEVMAAHHEGAYTGSKDLARGYRHAESVIRALKPAKGESK